MMFETEVQDLIIEDNSVKGVKILNKKSNKKQELFSDNVIIAVGRKVQTGLLKCVINTIL